MAFRVLVEQHQPMARVRVPGCASTRDVDDSMQESFLRALLALDRLREPGRSAAGWTGSSSTYRGLRGGQQTAASQHRRGTTMILVPGA